MNDTRRNVTPATTPAAPADTAPSAETAVPFDTAAAIAAAESVITEQLAAHRADGHPIPDPAWGIFCRGSLLTGTNTDGVYRIASMTKSFTASVFLGIKHGLLPSLPDAPALDLDAPLSAYIPALEWAAPRDSHLRRLTVRDVLTMSGGVPTDDPWADRQEALDRAGFDEVLASDIAGVFTPGTAYAYNNLGYALLGRVIEEQTGRPYVDVAGEAVAAFGLTSSAFSVAGLEAVGAAARLMPGYRLRDDGGAEELPTSGPGAFSAIGGLFSTVDDIGTWMALFLAAWHETDSWGRIRRDMQQPLRPTFDRAPALGSQEGALDFYGLGLHHVMDPELGTMIYHSGGYPGYGSHMRWHPGTGTGIVLFSNRTYGGATSIATAAFAAFLRAGLGAGAQAGPVPAPIAPRGSVHLPGRPDEFPAAIERWLVGIAAGDADSADSADRHIAGVFESNIDQDVPRAERIAAIRRVLDYTGAVPTATPPKVVWAADEAAWAVRGPHGVRRMELTLSPLGRVQTLDVTAEPNAPGEAATDSDPEADS